MLGSSLKFDLVMKRVFGSSNDRRLKGYRPKVWINALEPEFEALSDDELLAKTAEFRAQFAAGKTLDDLMAPAFAAVREAAKRTLKQRHFDVQLIGGLVLHEARSPKCAPKRQDARRHERVFFLNALDGRALQSSPSTTIWPARDLEWMAEIHQFLGMHVASSSTASTTISAPDLRR